MKLHLCHSARATDANIREALLDRYGPGKEKAVGRKAAPGPLFGVSKDIWSALAVAVTFSDQRAEPPRDQDTQREAIARNAQGPPSWYAPDPEPDPSKGDAA